MWYVVDKQTKQTINRLKDKKEAIKEVAKYEKLTGRHAELHKERVQKCIFSKQGYCTCWEGLSDKRCNGHKSPKGCPVNK